MSPRQATRYLYWYGEKMESGDPITLAETKMYHEAKEVSLDIVKKYLRLTPEDWKYTSGKSFK
jgi:hypothetical protein